MKKIIESDLIAIAHRILKMKDKSDINSLHTEVKNLYEKLSVLKFYEENSNRFDQAPAIEKIEELLSENPDESKLDNQEVTEKIVEELPKEIIETEDDSTEKPSLEFDSVFNVPFEKVEFEAVANTEAQKPSVVQTNNFVAKKNHTTVNDIFSKSITLTLNDRIAFEKHLFNNNAEDLNRVISQLNTMSDWEEAESFINQMVKPDFNHWQGKEDYENRFLTFIQKRFL